MENWYNNPVNTADEMDSLFEGYTDEYLLGNFGIDASNFSDDEEVLGIIEWYLNEYPTKKSSLLSKMGSWWYFDHIISEIFSIPHLFEFFTFEILEKDESEILKYDNDIDYYIEEVFEFFGIDGWLMFDDVGTFFEKLVTEYGDDSLYEFLLKPIFDDIKKDSDKIKAFIEYGHYNIDDFSEMLDSGDITSISTRENGWELYVNFIDDREIINIGGEECLYVERVVKLIDLNSLFDNLGIYWTWESGAGESYNAMVTGDDYTLCGWVPISDINISSTFHKFLYPLNYEKEIEIKEGGEVYLQKIELPKEMNTTAIDYFKFRNENGTEELKQLHNFLNFSSEEIYNTRFKNKKVKINPDLITDDSELIIGYIKMQLVHNIFLNPKRVKNKNKKKIPFDWGNGKVKVINFGEPSQLKKHRV